MNRLLQGGIGLLLTATMVSLVGCALPPPNLDANLSGTVATSYLAQKAEFTTQGIHKIALVVNELPYVAFDCFVCHFWKADPTDHYEVPQTELVPDGYLREQILAALGKQSDIKVVDESGYAGVFEASVIRVPWRDIFAIPQESPAFALLQTMRSQGIDAVLLVLETDENPYRFGNFLNPGNFLLSAKGILYWTGGAAHELIVYSGFSAVIISTADGKEIDGRDYKQGSYVTRQLDWQTAYEKYSPTDVMIMRDAIQERERVNAVQILRTFKILPPATPTN